MSEGFETKLREQAERFAYPSTPDVAGAVKSRLAQPQPPIGARVSPRLRLILWLLIGTLAIGSVAAVAWRVLRIGAVRIDRPVQTVMPSPVPATPVLSSTLQVTVTTLRALTPITTVRRSVNLYGETTLANARASVSFTVPLPTYPADIGPPDLVYHQLLGDDNDMVVLVWAGELRSRAVRMSLHVLTSGAFARKMQPKVLRETTVNGLRAAWVEGQHIFILRNGDYDARRLVDGNTLIWERDGITYRLESGLSMDEAVRVAESLR